MVDVFERLAGQTDVVAALRNAALAARSEGRPGEAGVPDDDPVPDVEARTGARMVHSWLFTGPPGSGRSVAARAFAAALQCEHPEIVGCGECRACQTVLAGTHPDVHRVATEGVQILLATVKEAIHRASSRPMTGRWQVMLIEDADRLNENSGNALLKVVEEPPARTVFLLCAPTTDPQDVMVTLRSRSRHVLLRQPTPASVEEALSASGSGIDAEMARWAASVSGGHVGRARWLATDQATRERRELVLSLPMHMHNPARAFPLASELVSTAEEQAASENEAADEREASELATALGEGGTGKGAAAAKRGVSGALKRLEGTQKSRRSRAARDSLDLALVDLVGFYRDALMTGVGAPGVPRVHPDKAAESARLGGHYPPGAVLQTIEAIQRCRESLEWNVKPKFALSAMVGEIRGALRNDREMSRN